ncbi:hypothetical protein [Streptomyces sp. NPDC058297]|uniref:hypothetical protein n=1 Tax=Streptomyces sp. NPDC058297 TaxID=3346433 RepID=UPI0036E7E257
MAGKGTSTAQPDARVERSNQTRQAVLSPTVEIVSVEGLQALPRAELEVPSLVQQLSGHRDLAGLRTRGTGDLQHVRHCVITLFRFTQLRARSFLDAEGICRLCRRQATLLHRDDQAASWEEVRTGGQQLYITGLFRSSVFTPRHLPPRPHPIPPPAHQQLVLFDMARSLHHRGGAERLADRAQPHLAAWAGQFTDRQAARLGWRRDLTRQAHTGVNFLLGLLDASGVRLSATDAALLKKIPYLPHAHVTDILEEAGLLAL